MIDKRITSTYPGFDESLASIKKFKSSGDLFSTMLTDGRIIHHTANGFISFKKWLLDNDKEDIGNSTTTD
ncbi:hypothetical protein [Mucilaginibacter sp. UYCu711]|uniref:hypothetical protein n=1 Tax=Mucilaginibacter sp. UYCu711 TaxID=3156339 RepID=UPI003D1FD8E0